ncbi:MAG: hypothetical protein JWP95_1639, partial [Actinotalea sp.]|nr:hypothetical protein [Actinotalea sp.]
MKADELDWLRDVVVELLRTSTQVPFGATEVQPGDPSLTRAVSDVILPRIEELGPAEIRRHPMGDVAARFGPPGDDGLLLQTYIVSQHANLMGSEQAGTVIGGEDGDLSGARVLGQGASQIKGPLASVLASLRSLPTELTKPVWLTVNTEGKSSHGGSRRILDDLAVTAASGVLAVGTDLRVSVGNRGRADVRLTVAGESCHSSQPWLGHNPIEDASDVVTVLRGTPLPEAHPLLGPASATPYQYSCHPVSPHTIPSEVRVVVDRRLLPGESPVQAVDAVREHFAAVLPGVRLTVELGEFMLPATVADDADITQTLMAGLQRVTGVPGETFISLNAFD